MANMEGRYKLQLACQAHVVISDLVNSGIKNKGVKETGKPVSKL